MGAEESIVGRILARRPGVGSVGSEHAVEIRAGLSVRKLVAQLGGSGFRAPEHEAIGERSGRAVADALGARR